MNAFSKTTTLGDRLRMARQNDGRSIENMAEMLAVAGACGGQTAATQARARRALAARRTPDPVDIEALEADLRHVMADRGHKPMAEAHV